MEYTEFTVQLAGMPIGVKSLYPRVREMCIPYLTKEAPVFTIVSTREQIEKEKTFSMRKRSDGEKNLVLNDDYVETRSVYRQIAERLIEYKILLLHGSAIAVDGDGYVFMAPSGTGKSTHTRLWGRMLLDEGHEVYMVNDDKPLLKIDGDTVYVCGTPWSGKHHADQNSIVPLRGVCVLRQGKDNSIRPLEQVEAWQEAWKQCYQSSRPDRVMQTMAVLDQIVHQVPFYKMYCNISFEAARMSYDTMSR